MRACRAGRFPRRNRLGRALRPLWPRLLLGLTALPAGALLSALRARPAWVETAYSRRIYPVLAFCGSRLTSLCPFSVVELCLLALALGLPAALIAALVRRKLTVRALLSCAATAVAAAGLGYTAFVLLWGLNYDRRPLAENLGYRAVTPTAAELSDALSQERSAVNALLDAGTLSFSGGRPVPPDRRQMERRVADGYRALAAQSPLFRLPPSPPKPVLLSIPWSYTGTEGIFVPLTYEPCYSTATPAFMQAFDMAHETAHLEGFAREDEANFVAYLSDTANPLPYFRYAGHLVAFCYLSDALNETDAALWQKTASPLDRRAWADIDAYNAYIDRISGPVADASDRANDQYLKAQGQPQGTRSYDEFVNLLVERRRAETGR